jgi:hypothetical protein
VLPDDDLVAIAQMVLGDLLVIDERAIRAVQVLDKRVAADGEDVGVFSAHGEIIEHDIAAGLATELHVALFEFDMIDDVIVKLDDQLCHVAYPK